MQRIIAIVLRHLYVWPRGIERFMWSVGWPLLELLIWGLTTSYLQKNMIFSVSLTTLILGAIIFWGITTRAQLEISISFLDEVWNKNILNIFTTPLTITEFLVATIILGMIKFTVSAGILTAVAYLGYKLNMLVFGWYLPLIVINLIIFAWSFGFFVTGLIIRFGRGIEEFAWSLIYFVQPFVCIFYPLSSLPSWAQFIGRLIPATYVFEELRRYTFTGEVLWENLMISFFLNAMYIFFSLVFLHVMFENARMSGRLTKLDG